MTDLFFMIVFMLVMLAGWLVGCLFGYMHVFQVAHNCHLLFQVVINCKSEKNVLLFCFCFAFCILPTTHYYNYNKKLFRTHTHHHHRTHFLTVLCTSFGIFFLLPILYFVFPPTYHSIWAGGLRFSWFHFFFRKGSNN